MTRRLPRAAAPSPLRRSQRRWAWPSLRRSTRPAVALVAFPVAGAVLLGALTGLVWSALAPRAEVVLTNGEPIYARAQPSAVIAADGWFTVVTGLAGLACGAALTLLGRRYLHSTGREITALASLACGGLLGSLTAAQVGRLAGMLAFRQRARTSPAGAHLPAPLELHATGLVVLWPILAVSACALLLLAAGAARRRGTAVRDDPRGDTAGTGGTGGTESSASSS